MKFLSAVTDDGLTLRGLYSRATSERATVVHVHGYGGDFYSNRFVQQCHETYPKAGYGFVSFGSRTMAYLYEIYSEGSVRYAGSSVERQDDVYLDIDAIIQGLDGPRVILQGHSFGSNIVLSYVRRRPSVAGAVFLSPADSVALYEQWKNSRDTAAVTPDDPATVRWDLFGMGAGKARYAIPVSAASLASLLEGDVFSQWSATRTEAARLPALVVQGASDPISAVGHTGREAFFGRVLPNSTVIRIPGAGHLFTGFESQLSETVLGWLKSLTSLP